MSNLVHVAIAIITNKKNEVLISLRAENAHQGGLWEFPGGKLEQGESVFNALKREIYEELNITIEKASSFKKIKHQYTDKNILLDVWKIDSFSGEPVGAEGQQIKWQTVSDLNEKLFPVANIEIIQALKLPTRYMITGTFKNHKNFEYKLEQALKKGISLVQLRCKKSTDEEYGQLIKISALLCKKYKAILLLNTDIETFLDKPADGFHLSSQMLMTIPSRPVEDNVMLSVSCHNEAEMSKAKQFNADIILLSPVKETKSHPGVKGIGWKKFTEIISGIKSPVYALGGMAEIDLEDAKKSGAQGVAAISSFWDESE